MLSVNPSGPKIRNMKHDELLTFPFGDIVCPDGGFSIDPRSPAKRAVITHGHSDHARRGHQSYLCHHLTVPILRLRLGPNIQVQGVEYGERVRLGDVTISLHPAGHIPGSAQIRVERNGEVWVAAGDYKLHDDGVSAPFEPVRCDAFITESTFGLPVYRWAPIAETAREINQWWSQNKENEKTSILTGYSLGKAQRLLAMLEKDIGPVFVHPSIVETNTAYRSAGLPIPEFPSWAHTTKADTSGAMIIMPPGAAIPATLRRFSPFSIAHASGWMTLRGNRRRQALDRGFVVSDHADWPELNQAIEATGAERIFVTHGQIETVVRWLNGRGYQAAPVPGYSWTKPEAEDPFS